MPHDVEISSFHVALELAAAAGGLAIAFWEQRRGQLLDGVEAAGERLSINPDALFALKNSRKPAEISTNFFFLELVRARESDYRKDESYFMRKMRAYSVAVETALSGDPPHRSVQAHFSAHGSYLG